MINFKELFELKVFKIVLIVLGAIIIALLIFQLGMRIGFTKAFFSYKWGENYHRNFGGPRGGFMPFSQGFFEKDFINPHGTYGKIVKIDLPNLVVASADAEKIILIKNNTPIQRFQGKISAKDLKEGDYIVVLGEPNDKAQIEAKLIRVLPAPLPVNNKDKNR